MPLLTGQHSSGPPMLWGFRKSRYALSIPPSPHQGSTDTHRGADNRYAWRAPKSHSFLPRCCDNLFLFSDSLARDDSAVSRATPVVAIAAVCPSWVLRRTTVVRQWNCRRAPLGNVT